MTPCLDFVVAKWPNGTFFTQDQDEVCNLFTIANCPNCGLFSYFVPQFGGGGPDRLLPGARVGGGGTRAATAQQRPANGRGARRKAAGTGPERGRREACGEKWTAATATSAERSTGSGKPGNSTGNAGGAPTGPGRGRRRARGGGPAATSTPALANRPTELVRSRREVRRGVTPAAARPAERPTGGGRAKPRLGATSGALVR
jgi:hypothetical protein